MKIQFFMPMIPPTVTAQEHKVAVRNGKPQFYDPPEVKDAKLKLTAALAKNKNYERPLCSPVRLMVKWLFPVTGSHKDGEYKFTRPDTDNLQKMLKDCMTLCGFWKDDALVVSEITEKFWADNPGIFIRIEVLKNGNWTSEIQPR
ncbi:MAG: RusA family crossover junction endodeoxyribonuclease [Ruminococcus sp.]